MSQSETWDALRLAAEWRSIGRDEEAARVMPDGEVAWKRCTNRRKPPKFYPVSDEDYGDYWDEPVPVGEQLAEHRSSIERMDWLTWVNPLTVRSMDKMLREAYPEHRISDMALAPNPFVAALTKGGDAIEFRIRSYANVVMPSSYGVFKIDSDGS